MIYLDNNATTRPDNAVVERVRDVVGEAFGNPSSVHALGQQTRAAIDEARASIAELVGCRDREITFTGSGTEATNTLLRGLASKRAGRIVTTVVEHDATHRTVETLGESGRDVAFLPVDEAGRLSPEALRETLDEDAAVVSVIWANNETGVVNDVASLAEVCREKGVPLHVDATQMVGKLPVDLHRVGCDAATFSPHKFHGLKGVGCLYVRRGLRVPPLVVGGPQERDRRGGTENVVGILAAGVAAETSPDRIAAASDIAAKRDRLEQSLVDALPDVRINGLDADRLPNTSNIAFKGVQAEALLMLMNEAGVCASAGAACSSGSLEPSRVLLAMGVPEPWAFGSIRLSLSRETTDADVDDAIRIISESVTRLRRVMPVAA
ncbi:MAG: cysteine desulfurase family protein [Planctomycetota bacterium]